MSNQSLAIKDPSKPWLASRSDNNTPFRPILRFKTRKEAKEADEVLWSLHRNGQPVKPFTVLHKLKSVQFYCDGPETAKLIRERYFSGAELTWDTLPEEREEFARGIINLLPPVSPFTVKDHLDIALSKLERALERLSSSGDLISKSFIDDSVEHIKDAVRKSK